MVRMTGAQALVEMLRAEGVKYVFGNPGTTELPFLDALQDTKDIQYINALFEGVAAGMADGYARVTQMPSFMNFHISVGVTNSIAVMYNSWRGGTPMVITSGQAPTSLQLHNPTLYSNTVNVMREYTKWAGEVVDPTNIPSIIRRAFKVASTPPTGPVFVSLGWDALQGEADVDIVPSARGYFCVRPDVGATIAAAKVLAIAKNPLILIGDRVSQSPGAPLKVAEVAEQLGAPVYSTSFSEVNIPSSHPYYMGTFDTSWLHRSMKERFDQADAILAIGTDMMTQSIPTPEPPFTGPPKIVHMDCSAWDIQRSYPVSVGLLCDIQAGLEELLVALEDAMSGSDKEAARLRGEVVAQQKLKKLENFQHRVNKKWGDSPMSPERFVVELKNALPPNALVCDDSITIRNPLLTAIDFDTVGSLIGGRGGSLGFGMGATLGMKLAAPDVPVIGVIGDGTAMYSIQALWTAANYNIPVTYVMCNNSGYKVLRENMARYLTGTERQSDYIGMDFHKLPLDFVKLAQAFGIEGIRVERPADLCPAIQKALDSGKTMVLDVILDDSFDPIRIQEDWGKWALRR